MHPFLKSVSLSVEFLAASSLVSFAEAPAFSRDPASVQAGVYSVEPMPHPRVVLGVAYGLLDLVWRFHRRQRLADPRPQKRRPKARWKFTVPVASVSTTNAKLDGELKGDQWLDAAKYPEMVFKSDKVVPTGKDKADVEGQLTLHGVTRPLTLHATFNGAGVNVMDKHYTVGFEAKGQIKRSDFGVKTYVPLIGDDVDLILSAAFEKQ